MVHIETGVTYEQCIAVFGAGSPLCDVYRHPLKRGELHFVMFNPFNRDIKPVADTLTSTVKSLLGVWGTFTGTEFVYVTTATKGNNEVIIFLDEFSKTGTAKFPPLLAYIAVFVAVFVAYGVIMVYFNYVEKVEETKQAAIALEAKQTDAKIVDQVNTMVANGTITQDQANTTYKTLFPKGISQEPDRTTEATDNILKTIEKAFPLILGLAALGIVASFAKKG